MDPRFNALSRRHLLTVSLDRFKLVEFSKKNERSLGHMKEYDPIAVGTGSAMNILDTVMQSDRGIKVAVIDKDEPGGICLTRGCIPSKILLYPTESKRSSISVPAIPSTERKNSMT